MLIDWLNELRSACGTPKAKRIRRRVTANVIGMERLEPRILLSASPFVQSISRADSATTSAAAVNFTVTFSSAVSGVDASDFQVATTGGVQTTGLQVTPVSGSVYTITVSGITGAGTLGLNLVENNSIRDLSGNGLVQSGTPLTYQNQQTFAVGASPAAVAQTDINGDGRQDLILASYDFMGNGQVTVLLGNGDGNFQAAINTPTYSSISYAASAAIGDVNGDGRPDLAVTTTYGSFVSVLLGNGNGTFQSPQTFQTGSGPYTVAMGDLNGDGRLDIVTGNENSDSISVLLGNGNGTFQAQQTYQAGDSPQSVTIGDVNSDNRLDVVVANGVDDNVSVLLGNGNGTFQTQQTLPAGGNPVSVVIGDVNGDNRADIVAANFDDATVSVFLGNGNGTFQAQRTTSAAISLQFANFLAAGDLNGDGRLDLALVNYASNTTSVLLGNVDGTFLSATTFATGSAPKFVTTGDANGDGRLDLAIANSGSNTVSVLLNAASGNFTGETYNIIARPSLSGSSTTTYVENAAPVAINGSITVAAGSSTLASATITITNFVSGQDLLAFTNNGTTMGNIAVATNVNGVLTLTSAGGTATLAQWQAALRSVTYANSSENPSTTTRSVSFVVNDGFSSSTSLNSTVAVTAVNDASILAGTSALNYTKGSAPTPVNASVTVTDIDNATLVSAAITLTDFVAGQDVLGFINDGSTMGNIALTTNANGVLTLASAGGTATLAQLQAALRAVTYANSSSNPDTTPRTVTFVVNDGSNPSNAVASTINVTTTNVLPVLAGTSTLNYTENDAARPINPAIVVTDVDSATLASATVTLTNYVAGQDVLGFINDGATMGNITVASNLNGVLTLVSDGGTATLAQWQAALRVVSYVNTSNNPDTTPRSVEFVVNDFVPASIDIVPGVTGPSPIRLGFDTLSLPANDDSSQLASIGFTINFFGVEYNSVYVNNNGNLTFNAPLPTYTPFDLLSTNMAIIAPFFGDVDTRQGNVVTFGQGMVDGHLAFAVNYVDVRHFNASGSPMDGLPTNSFQVVLIDRSDIAPGAFDIEFNYGNIAWESGTASGGDAAGLGGTAARAGFSNGISTALELPGSAINGAFLDSGPAATSLVHNSFNSTVSGRYVFEARNGTIDVGTASNPVTSTVNVTAVNDPPQSGAGFVIQGGGQAFVPNGEPLTAIVHLTASDPDTPADQLVYMVSNVVGGRFVLLPDKNTPISSFTQADVDAGRVAFVFDGTESEPTFDLTVGDGTASLPSMSVEAESPAPLTKTTLVDGVLYLVGSEGKDVVHIKQKGDKIVIKFKGGDKIKKDLSDVDEIVLMLNGGGDEVKISKKVSVEVSQAKPVTLRVSPAAAAPPADGLSVFDSIEYPGLPGSALGAQEFPLLSQAPSDDPALDTGEPVTQTSRLPSIKDFSVSTGAANGQGDSLLSDLTDGLLNDSVFADTDWLSLV